MKCILEDKEDSILSQFFKSGIKKQDVLFAESNSNLWRLAEGLVEDKVLFLDINPWNKQLCRLYVSLCDRAKNGVNNNLIILPIVCAEYNLLYGLRDRADLITNKDMYNLILHKEVGSDYTKYGSHTYEKFCKLVLDSGVVSKVSTNREINPDYLYYTNEDCDEWNLDHRRLRFYQQYRVVPLKVKSKNSSSVSFLDIFYIHQEMIDWHNNWAKAVGSKSILPKQKYEDIFRD